MITSTEEVKSKVCHNHGHQLTSYNGFKDLICRACGSTFTEIRGEQAKK